jgi:hypothetical protein
VRPQARRQRHLGGDPQGRLRQPRVLPHAGQQGLPVSLLLAHSSRRCRRTRQRCQGCQYFAKQQHVPAYKLVTIPPTSPFACWGLDMIGPLPTAPGGFNRVLVAID